MQIKTVNMNIFRLAGDMSHLLAIIILLVKIWKTRSCAGKVNYYHWKFDGELVIVMNLTEMFVFIKESVEDLSCFLR